MLGVMKLRVVSLFKMAHNVGYTMFLFKNRFMKRMNKKKILEVLETARQGYASLTLKARQIDDKIMEQACQAHHGMLNRQIVELGGESVEAPFK
jgi:hypothetical protein